MSRNINRAEGGGPWLLTPATEGVDPLGSGETVQFDLDRMSFNGQQRYFHPWTPVDEVLLKNLNTDNAVTLTVNHQYDAYIEPNAADSFSDVGITHVEIRNEGGTGIPASELKLQLKVNPYNADDAALEKRQRGTLANIVRGQLGL